MTDGKKTGRLARPAKKKFLVLFHLTKTDQTMLRWDAFVSALHKGEYLIGGSALAKPSAIKSGESASSKCASVGGYMVITAPSIAKVRELMKKSPTHLCGGLVEVFPLVLS